MNLDTIACADALDYLAALPDKSVDMVFTDPPYGNNNGVDDLAAARARDKVRGGRQCGDIPAIANDDRQSWEMLMPRVFAEFARVLKPEASCCCCCGGGGPSPVFASISQWMDSYMTFFHAVVWDKSGRGDGLGWRYRRNYEFVMVAHPKNGKLAWNDTRPPMANVLRDAPVPNVYHPTQKPLSLIRKFIENHSKPGDVILDPFMGSGTTLVAAKQLGRHYIGCDLSPEYVAIAQKRLAEPYTLPLFQEAAQESTTEQMALFNKEDSHA